jgi:kynurenine formamidase
MNTKIRDWMPRQADECETFFKSRYHKTIDEMFPPDHYQLMHIDLFPHDIIHAENLGGDIDKVLNRRMTIGCFPWRWIGGESSICRIVAFEMR